MNKKALLFAVTLLMSVSAFAQLTATWTKPAAPTTTAFAPETEFYLYNVGMDLFWTNHQGGTDAPYYGTHAAVDAAGQKVIFTRTNPGSNANEDLEASTAWGENEYLLVSYVTKFGAMMCAFYTAADDVWTDNNGQANRYWTVEASGNTLKIKGCSRNEVDTNGSFAGASYYLGVEKDNAAGVCHFDAPTSEDAVEGAVWNVEWACVTIDDYKAYTRYLVAQQLADEIQAAKDAGATDANLQECYNVYNNTNSTYDQLEAAVELAKKKARAATTDAVFAGVVNGQKNDVSAVFTNPDFEDGTVNGWDITWQRDSEGASNIGYQGSSYTNGDVTISHFIEAWKNGNSPNYLSDGSITQTIPELPQGKYMLAVDVIANNQGRINDPSNPNGLPDDVELYAEALTTGAIYSEPMATRNEKPEHFEFTFVHDGGDMTLGLRVINASSASMPANWIAMDNLQLFYYGPETADPAKIQLDAFIEQVEAYYPNIDDVYAQETAKDNLKTALSNAKSASSDYDSYRSALQTAFNNLKASEAAYKTVGAFIDAAYARLDSFVGTSYESASGPVADMVADWEDAYKYGTASVDDIDSWRTQFNAKIMEVVTQNCQPGDDISIILENPNFDTDFSGWQTTGTAPVWGGNWPNPNGSDYSETALSSGCAERYHATFSMYQVLKDLVPGVYDFTCQAFDRRDDNAGENKKGGATSAVLYAVINGQEQSAPVPNIHDYATASQVYAYGEHTPDGNNDVEGAWGWVPDGMSGSNFHFQHDENGDGVNDYTVTLNVIVSQKSDVTIGLKNDNGGTWVIFDNFRLIYRGEDVQIYKDLIDERLTTLETILGEKAYGNDVEKKYTDVSKEAAQANTVDACKSALTKLESLISEVKQSVAAYDELNKALEELATALDESSAPQSVKDDALAVYEAVGKQYDDRTATVASIPGLIDQIAAQKVALAIGDYKNASDNNPIDVTAAIVNPSFETGDLSGWTYNKGDDTICADNGNSTYTVSNADGSYVFNTWSGTIPEGGLWVEQTIVGMPEGTYELTVLLASDMNSEIDLSASGNPVPFIMYNDKGTGQDETICFALAEGQPLVIRASSPNTWFKVDNFRLTYYGTDSAKEPTAVAGIQNKVTVNTIYTASGARVQTMQKGINIVRMSDGSVRKVLVK